MSAKLLLLERNIQGDLEALDRLYEALGDDLLTGSESEEALIVVAYRLHSLYNACENIFRNIAIAFENHLDEKAGWHTQLLQRMRLDLMPVRPAVIDDDSHEKLDELLRFRHLFRSAYGLRLDAERLALVQRKALEVRKPFREQVEVFLGFLRDLRAES